MVPLEYGVEDGAVLLDGGAVDGVFDEKVGVGQRLDLLVVVEIGEDADAELLVLALHGARQRLLQGGVHVASVELMQNLWGKNLGWMFKGNCNRIARDVVPS